MSSRNIVNSYVWTADCGVYAETTKVCLFARLPSFVRNVFFLCSNYVFRCFRHLQVGLNLWAEILASMPIPVSLEKPGFLLLLVGFLRQERRLLASSFKT